MGPHEAHHALSPSMFTLSHRGRSYLKWPQMKIATGPSSSASNCCTCCEKDSWKTELDRTLPWPNSSLPWPYNPLTDKGNCPFSTFCIKFATEPSDLVARRCRGSSSCQARLEPCEHVRRELRFRRARVSSG